MNPIWSDEKVIAGLSRFKFGIELARQVAAKLKAQCISGGLYYSHRDYCGHGLIYRDGQFMLIEVYDGFPDQSQILATWDSEEEFVGYVAELSDFTCSGADAEVALFYTNDSFWLNNQRITMDWLREYVATANDSS